MTEVGLGDLWRKGDEDNQERHSEELYQDLEGKLRFL